MACLSQSFRLLLVSLASVSLVYWLACFLLAYGLDS